MSATNPRNLTLITPAASGASFLYTSIDVAVAIYCQNIPGVGSIETVSILRAPMPRRFALTVVNGIAGVLARLPEWTRKVVLAGAPRRLRSRLSAKSLYFKLEAGLQAEINTGSEVILIKPLAVKSAKAILLVRALRMWAGCFVNGRFNHMQYLQLRYRGAEVGRLSASATLRDTAAMGGRLQPKVKLFLSLVDAITICDWAWQLEVGCATYVMVSEPSYLCAIYEQVLSARNARVITLHSYKSLYEVRDTSSRDRYPWTVESDALNSDVNWDQVRKYMELRLAKPEECFPYMPNWVDKASMGITSLDGTPVFLAENDKVAVVFLHSFSDAQYSFGIDGFRDIYHWTEFTIDQLLANDSVDWVFIKPHPGVDLGLWPCDQVAIGNLRAKYIRQERVVFLDSSVRIDSLANVPRIVGITHHGSVAEEFVFLGRRMIGSVYSTWSDRFPFLTTWRDPSEYQRILGALFLEEDLSTDNALRALAKFITEYRFREVDYRLRMAWISYAQWIDGPSGPEKCNSYAIYSEYLERLESGTQECDGFLNNMSAKHRCR